VFVRCVSVCVSGCVRSGPVNLTSLKLELNANSFKMVKAKDFTFDTHVSRDSPGMTPYIFFEKGHGQGHVTP